MAYHPEFSVPIQRPHLKRGRVAAVQVERRVGRIIGYGLHALYRAVTLRFSVAAVRPSNHSVDG